jgi:hypothetical protein
LFDGKDFSDEVNRRVSMNAVRDPYVFKIAGKDFDSKTTQ